jgi:hypothetical protein
MIGSLIIQPRTPATHDPPRKQAQSDDKSACGRCRWLEQNDYTRSQTKMTFVCWLAQRFLFDDRLRQSSRGRGARAQARSLRVGVNDLIFFGEMKQNDARQ